MILILDDWISEELKDYLLTQDGITNVDINEITKDYSLTALNIEYNKNIIPETIMKHIELFQNNKFSILFEFDKCIMGNFKTLNYVIDDICCEYCYKDLVRKLFKDDRIKSVKSNFDFNKPAHNIKLIIECSENFNKQELTDYIVKD